MNVDNSNDFQVLRILNQYTKIAVPKNLVNLDNAEILHTTVCKKDEMKKELLSYLYDK